MQVLVTRPLEQARATASVLESGGHSVTIEPMLEVQYLPTPLPAGSFSGMILTSANALPVIARLAEPQQLLLLPVITTGKATATAALNHGFVQVDHQPGSALDLIAQLPTWMERRGISDDLLYPCAETTAHDLSDLLAKQGIRCWNWPVYRTEAARDFTAGTKRGLHNRKFDAVLLYSKRTAHTFVQLMQQNNIAMEGLRTYVMSQEIYNALPKELQDHAQYPDIPVETELLNLIEP